MQKTYSVALYSAESKYWPIVSVIVEISFRRKLPVNVIENAAHNSIKQRIEKMGIDLSKHSKLFVSYQLIDSKN